MPALEAERDSKLLIDADAVPPGLVTPKRLEPVARRNAQVIQSGCGMEGVQLPSNHGPELLWKPTSNPRIFSVEDVACGRVVERPDHGDKRTWIPCICQFTCTSCVRRPPGEFASGAASPTRSAARFRRSSGAEDVRGRAGRAGGAVGAVGVWPRQSPHENLDTVYTLLADIRRMRILPT